MFLKKIFLYLYIILGFLLSMKRSISNVKFYFITFWAFKKKCLYSFFKPTDWKLLYEWFSQIHWEQPQRHRGEIPTRHKKLVKFSSKKLLSVLTVPCKKNIYRSFLQFSHNCKFCVLFGCYMVDNHKVVHNYKVKEKEWIFAFYFIFVLKFWKGCLSLILCQIQSGVINFQQE